MAFMSDKFRKHLPPGAEKDNGGFTIKQDPREGNGAFNNSGPKQPKTMTGTMRPAGQPKAQRPSAPAGKPGIRDGVPWKTNNPGTQTGGVKPGGQPKPAAPGNFGIRDGVPWKTTPAPSGGKPGIRDGVPWKTAAPKQGAHQEFIKRAKEQGIGEKEITKFIAKKIRPKKRK